MADVTVTLGAKDTGLQNALKKTQSSVAALKPAMVGIAAAGAAAFAALAGAAAGVKAALDMGGLLSDIAGQTGMTAGKVMLLRTAFDQAGIGADQVGPAINKMQKALAAATSGTGPAADALAKLGLNATDLANMAPDQAFKTLGEAINGIGNPTERAAAAMEIFGRSGGKMLTLFGDAGALSTAADTLGGQAAIMDKNAAVFDRVSDLMNASSNKLQGVFVGLAEPLAAVVLPLFERLNSLDFTQLGQRLGDVAAMFIEAMTDGSIWTIMSDSLRLAMGNAANFLFRALSGVVTSIVRVFAEIPKNLITGFGIVTKADFWKGMLSALIGIAAAFGSKFLGIIAEALELFSRIPGIGSKLQGPMEAVRGAAENLGGIASDNLASGGDRLAPFLAQLRERTGANLGAIRDGFNEGFDGAGDVFDLSGVQSNLDSTFARLGNTVESLKTQAQAALPGPNTAGGLQSAFGATGDPTGAAGATGAAAQATNQPLFASSLAKIGGGGGIAGAPALLDESRKHTLFLKRIAEGIGRLSPQPALS